MEFDQKLLSSILCIIRKCSRYQGRRQRLEQILSGFSFLFSFSFHNILVLFILLSRVFPPSLLSVHETIYEKQMMTSNVLLWISLLKLLKAVSTTLLFYSLAFLWCLLQLSPAAELGWASGPLLGWRNPEGTYSTDSSQIHRRKKSLLEKEAAGRSQRRWDKNSHVLCYVGYPVQPFKIK